MPWTRSQGPCDDSCVCISGDPLTSSLGTSEEAARSTVEEQRARWERKRVRTVKELVETERQYVEQLGLVTTYFVKILSAKAALRRDIRESIFGPVESIYQANDVLLQSLERCQFGAGIEAFCLHLELYRRYADGLEQALKVLQIQVKYNISFARFKRLQEGRRAFQGLRLEELLPLPLQRILQYKHLLRDLVENTSPDATEFHQLTRAVKAVSEVAQYIQDNAHSYENYLQLVRVQKLLKGRKTTVLTPGHMYIREGWLAAVPQKGKEVKRKMFFLFSDILLMTRPCHPLHPVNSDKFCCQAVYPLEECAVEKVFGHTDSQGSLISLSFAHEKLLLMSNDQEDINDWFRCLSAAVGQLKALCTVIKRKENAAVEPQNAGLATVSNTNPGRSHLQERKRNLNKDTSQNKPVSDLLRCQPAHGTEHGETVPKRAKLSEVPGPAHRFQEDGPPPPVCVEERAGHVCVIL